MDAETTFAVQEVSQMDMAFGTTAMSLMPAFADIPDKFKAGDTKWNQLTNDWFFIGLSKLDIAEKDGIDLKMALRHIKTIMGSFEPPHEHKEAGIAFLMDQWFEDAKWTKAK